MILADTSIWIEFLRGNAKYSAIFSDLIEQRQVQVIECVFGELLQGVKNEKEATVIQEYWHNLPQVDMSGIWISAGYLCFREKFFSRGIGIIDAALLIAAKKQKLRLWTLDKKLLQVVPTQNKFITPF